MIAGWRCISSKRFYNVLHQYFKVKKVCTDIAHTWPKKVFSWSVPTVQVFPRNVRDILRCFVTVVETWIHYYTSEKKKHPIESIASRESELQKWRPLLRLRKLWSLSSRIVKDQYSLAIWERKKLLQVYINCIDSALTRWKVKR